MSARRWAVVRVADGTAVAAFRDEASAEREARRYLAGAFVTVEDVAINDNPEHVGTVLARFLATQKQETTP